jgi:hypothetical protein
LCSTIRERQLGIRVVHDRRALVIAVQSFGLKSQRPILERAESIIEELVDHAGKYKPTRRRPQLVAMGEIVDTRFDADQRMIEHVLEHPGISIDRNSLIGVAEIAVVPSKPDRNAA